MLGLDAKSTDGAQREVSHQDLDDKSTVGAYRGYYDIGCRYQDAVANKTK